MNLRKLIHSISLLFLAQIIVIGSLAAGSLAAGSLAAGSLAAGFSTSALTTQAAPASTYTVNSTAETSDVNTGDNICADEFGFCSLRAAVMQANAHAGEDTINLPTGTYHLTMRLEPVDDLIIDGAGKANTIIDGAGSAGAEGFRVRADVQFEELTLRDFPKAIYISSTESNHQVTVTDSALRDNTNTNTSNSGSAIVNYCTSCTISLSNVDVYDNASPFCGAISAKGALILSNNTLVHANQATSTYGGGICTFDGSLNVMQSRVYGNDALDIENGYGGGIYQSGGSVSLYLSEVYGNSAHIGGGIYIAFSGDFSALNAQIYANSAASSAGGLMISGDGTVVIDSSIIRENTAAIAGGAFIWSSAKIVNSTVISNTVSGNGGGFYVNDHTLTLVNTTLSGNRADNNGGGIYITNNAVAQLANVTVSNNTADANNDTNGLGGGIYQTSSGVIRFKNSIIAGNKDLTSQMFEIWGPDCSGTLTSDGYNLLGLGNALCTLAGDLTGMQYGAVSPGLYPRLGPLTFYAVEYYYHPVLFGPAVDRGNPSGCKDYANAAITADQLNQLRPYAPAFPGYTPRCDLGAVESFYKSFTLYLPSLLR